MNVKRETELECESFFCCLMQFTHFKVLICKKVARNADAPLPYEDLIKFSNSFATENEKMSPSLENDSAEISIRYLFFKDLFQALEGLSYFKQCSHSIRAGTQTCGNIEYFDSWNIEPEKMSE